MKNTYRAVAALAAGLAGLTSPLHAQELNLQGSTKGCFYSASESGCTPGVSSSRFFLSFLGSTFNVSTVDGMAGIGAAAGTPNVNNLGSFFVTGNPASYTGTRFWLDVLFSTPTITSATTVFTAALKGSVTANANGLVSIRFDSDSQVFDYTSGDQTGDFTLSLNNVSLTPGSAGVALTGDIERGLTITATPEPSSMVLMATAFAGLAGFVRKRRRNI
jgi:PEP-CTERM motif